MKVASMSMKGMQTYIQAIPYEKLEKALEVLGNFDVNRLGAVAFKIERAKDLIRDRLYDEVPVDGPKASKQSATDKPINPKEREILARLIGNKKYSSANKLADNIRAKREAEVGNGEVVSTQPEGSRGQGGDSGRRAGTPSSKNVSGAGAVVSTDSRRGAGSDTQNREGNGNRNAGERNPNENKTGAAGVKPGQNDKVDLAKQDAWVLKLASTPRRDALTAVLKLPYEKLQKAYDALSTFSPANNTNPFWQHNSLDLYTRDMERTVTRAMELIEDRLYDEAPVDGPKYSEMSTGGTYEQGNEDGDSSQVDARNSQAAIVGVEIEGRGDAERSGAFSRRIANVSNAFLARLENPKVKIRHKTPLSSFGEYSTEADFIPELNSFGMFVFDKDGLAELGKSGTDHDLF